jgi:hypothetical protein
MKHIHLHGLFRRILHIQYPLSKNYTDSNTFWEDNQDDSRKNNEERCIKFETFLV